MEQHPHFLETAQQDLQAQIFSEQAFDQDLQHALDRSCTPHCVEAIGELTGLHIPSLDRFQEYVAFLRDHGPHPTEGSNNPEIYTVNDGWFNIAIADLLRSGGYAAVSQSLEYDKSHTDLAGAAHAGRIRSQDEGDRLARLSENGGGDRAKWLEALHETTHTGGYPIVSLTIPSRDPNLPPGTHSVLVLGVDEHGVRYFDPDKLAIERYRERAQDQHIIREDDTKLIYTQPASQFQARMTGLVLHIWPPMTP